MCPLAEVTPRNGVTLTTDTAILHYFCMRIAVLLQIMGWSGKVGDHLFASKEQIGVLAQPGSPVGGTRFAVHALGVAA